MLMNRFTPLVLMLLFLYGCAATPNQPSKWQIETTKPALIEQDSSFSLFGLFQDEDDSEEPMDEAEYDPELLDSLVDDGNLKGLLYSQLREWRSVRYRLGGMSKRGIDCSAFVYLTYRDKLGIELPRITTHQSTAGRSIRQAELKSGDLVFFHVDRRTRHVGIYLEDRKFMHVSSKKGVTVSSLDNQYWSKRYWKSVRVPEVLVAMGMN